MNPISFSCGLTVLDATGGTRTDVLVSTDGAATIREVAQAILDELAPRAPGRPAGTAGGFDAAGGAGGG
ncbi:MAG TPA: hypothetical protein VE776_04350, partial [Actinomycetota bacterium]|nr:hypothetical protein [Actinomycetota bacterium]